MFEQFMATISKPAAQNGFGYTQQLMESTMRLTQAQMEVMSGFYNEVGQDFSKTMASSADQSAMARNWQQLMATTVRANAEAGALLMKNAQEYHSELLQMMQSVVPGLSGKIMSDMMEIAKMSPVANGGAAAQATRTKKAA